MAEIIIPFATQSDPAEFREFGGERLVNAYATVTGQGRNAKVTVRMSPGLTTFSTGASDIGLRGRVVSGDYIYAVFETGVYKIDSAGARTLIGYISGQGKVYMALNASGQIGVVNSLGRYYLIENDTITSIPTSDIGTFNSICWIEGYFVLTLENGQFFNTGLDDGASINGIDFATAEGSPDGLLGGFAHGSELWLFGKETIEVWGNTGASPGSPFQRLGGSWINKGCMSFASVVQADNTLCWVGNDGIVYRGMPAPRRISHEGVERAIAGAADQANIRGDTYTIDGHIYYLITDDNFTWVYDLKENRWHERKTYGYDNWRVTSLVYAFGKWLAGSDDDGNLYEIDMDARTDGSLPIVSEMVSPDIGATPRRFLVSHVEIDFVTGRAPLTGTTPQTAPQFSLSYSDDGGATFSTARLVSLGSHGEYTHRVRENRFGQTGAKFGRRWKVSCSDPHIRAMSRFVMHVEDGGA